MDKRKKNGKRLAAVLAAAAIALCGCAGKTDGTPAPELTPGVTQDVTQGAAVTPEPTQTEGGQETPGGTGSGGAGDSSSGGNYAGGAGDSSSGGDGQASGQGGMGQETGGSGAEADNERESGLQVVIYSNTKADFIIDHADMELGHGGRYAVSFAAPGQGYCVELYDNSDEGGGWTVFIGKAQDEELLSFGAIGGSCTYRCEDDRLTLSFQMAGTETGFRFYDVVKYRLECETKSGRQEAAFAAADVVEGGDALLAGGAGTVELTGSLQVLHIDRGWVKFVVEPYERGRDDSYQVVCVTGDEAYCVQVQGFGDGTYVKNRLLRSVNADHTEFEAVEGRDSIISFTTEGDRLIIDAYLRDQELDFNRVESFTLRYLKNNGYDGRAEAAFAAADIRSAPPEWFAYADDGNGGVMITGFEPHGVTPGDVYIPGRIDGRPVTTIGEYAFTQGVGNVYVPDSVTKICSEAFRGSAITSVTIPGSVTEIGEAAFNGCDEMVSVTIRGGRAVIAPYAFHGYVTLSADQSTRYAANSLTSVDIDVKSIGEEAFRDNRNLKSVRVVAETIGTGAFDECGMTSAFIDADIIGTSAFYECANLTDVTLGENVREIGDHAFEQCFNLSRINFPAGVRKIGNEAFRGCGLSGTITVPATWETIGYRAFTGCAFTGVIFGEGVKKGGDFMFQACKELTSITFSGTMTEIGESAFGFCEKLSDVTIPGNIKTVSAGAFRECDNLTNVVIEEGVEVLDNDAFRQCYGNLHVSLPNSLKEIRNYVFSSDKNMSVTYKGATYTYATLDALYKAVNGR